MAAIDAAMEALRNDGVTVSLSTAQATGYRTLTAIATPASKAIEPGIRAAATERGLPLLAIAQTDLEAANAATVTRSAHSMAAMNVHSVAEAAALAGAIAMAEGMCITGAVASANAAPVASANTAARLLLPRIVVGPVTCALASLTP